MCPQLLVDIVVGSLVEKIHVHFSQNRAEGIGIPLVPSVARMSGEFERVAERSRHSGQGLFEQPGLMHPRQFKPLARMVVRHDFHLGRIRAEDPCHPAFLKLAQSENPEGIAMTGFNERIEIIVGKE